MAREFCPDCGEARVGVLRYCQKCWRQPSRWSKGQGAKPATHRPNPSARTAETLAQTSSSLVRVYHAKTTDDANRLFAADARVLAQKGWSPTTQSWAAGNPGVGRIVTLGILAWGARPDGTLTVTFGRTSVSAPERPDEFDQLRKLAELRDRGILTAAEFEAKKAEILRRS